MFDDDIRDGLFELAEHAPFNGDLEGIRSAGIRKRRVRQAGIATAATLGVSRLLIPPVLAHHPL